MRTRVATALVGAVLLLSACSDAPRAGSGGGAGFVPEDVLAARRLEYLRFATERLAATSPTNVIAHLERARIDDGYALPDGAVPIDAWDRQIAKMAALEDTRDFDALDLLVVVLGYRDDPALAPGLVEKVEAALRSFKFWYTEPTPPGMLDNSYYWTENHQVLFHTIELLVGQTWPDAVMASDGRTGREHGEVARERLLRWMDLRARFGFSEWHSNVYYQEDLNGLITLVEFAEDDEIATRAAMLLDVLLLDMALHTHRDAFGVTHGRSYKKDKMTSLDDDTWNGVKLLFDRSTYPFRSISATDAVFLSRARRYRVPEVVRRIARTSEPFVDRERMGIALDELAPFSEDPVAPHGFSFTDPADLPVWWGIGALTAWQVVPLTVATLEGYDLWTTTNFAPFAGLRPLTANIEGAQRFAAQISRYFNFGLLSEVDTYTYRTGDYMLSSAVDYRKGTFRAQVHTWQATLDANAIVFTDHPFRPLPETLDWSDRDLEQGGYWTGEAALPRAAQHENVGIYLYAPQWEQRNPAPLDYFRWEPYTHAYFPQDHFDEVVQEGAWTIGRKGDGYVALYSWRPTRYLVYDPSRFATNGMVKPFDLVAEGGADNVWIVECASASDYGSFSEFRSAIAAASVEVVSRGPGRPGGISDGFDVTYVSPSQGPISFGWEAPFVVAGREVVLDRFPRFENPFVAADFGARTLSVEHEEFTLRLDFDAPSREVSGPR
jgi:hypothetical protein